MLAEFLIELKLNEEQDKIAQILTGSSGAAKHSVYDEYVNASKGKVPSKGKGKGGDGEGGKSNWRAPCDEFWKPAGCPQGHNCPKHHPRRQPGRYAICGATHHYTSQRTRPLKPKAKNAEWDETTWQQEEVEWQESTWETVRSIQGQERQRQEVSILSWSSIRRESDLLALPALSVCQASLAPSAHQVSKALASGHHPMRVLLRHRIRSLLEGLHLLLPTWGTVAKWPPSRRSHLATRAPGSYLDLLLLPPLRPQ